MKSTSARLPSAATLALAAACLLAAPSPALWAKEPKAAAAKDGAATAQDLLARLEAASATRIECKAGTSFKAPVDGKWVDAALVAVTLTDAEGQTKDGATFKLAWRTLDSGSAAAEILKKAVDPKNAGENLLAARILANLKMGGALAEYHFKLASALDKTLASPKAKEALELLAVADFNRDKPAWGWERLTPTQHAECLKATDEFIKDTAKKAGVPLRASGATEHFACYSDADPDVVRNWIKKFEFGYTNLCKVFDLDPRINIFKGKCAVILCRNRASYEKWVKAALPEEQGLGAKTLGLHVCNQIFSGSCAVYVSHDSARQAQVEHVMGHELSHAFTSFFHGTARPANWANEGLAEYIATGGKGREASILESRERIRKMGSLEDLFDAPNIQGFHYGAAFELVRLLIKKNPQGYGRFIKAMTEGMNPEDALKAHCGLTLDQLAAGYAKSLGLKSLKAR